jgi:hypothetical protein
MPLPNLDGVSPEARIGLPEVEGLWSFAGWEVARGDSTVVDRSFPGFGDLHVDVQRLDSIAGLLTISGRTVPFIGEVRRSGRLAMVTVVGEDPGRFVAGVVQSDTLWFEMGSILSTDEWPMEARAAYVRDVPEGPAAWVRGALRETTAAPVDSAGIALSDTSASIGARPDDGPSGRDVSAGQAPRPPAIQPAVPGGIPPDTPAVPPPPPPPPPPVEPEVVQPDEVEPRLPTLLGEPIRPEG